MKRIVFISLFISSSAFAAPKYKLYDFWASWCGPCKESFPVLNTLHEKYGSKIKFIGVNMDLDKRDMRIFLKNNPTKFTQIRDENKELIKKYQVQGLPTVLVVNEAEEVLFRINGYDSREHKKLNIFICQTLEKKKPSDCDSKI